MILLSDHRFVDNIIHIVTKSTDEDTIVTTHEIASIIGNRIYREYGRIVNIVVFKNNYPEENSLKIIVYNYPDVVIDCDPHNQLGFIKNIVVKMGLPILQCNSHQEL